MNEKMATWGAVLVGVLSAIKLELAVMNGGQRGQLEAAHKKLGDLIKKLLEEPTK